MGQNDGRQSLVAVLPGRQSQIPRNHHAVSGRVVDGLHRGQLDALQFVPNAHEDPQLFGRTVVDIIYARVIIAAGQYQKHLLIHTRVDEAQIRLFRQGA